MNRTLPPPSFPGKSSPRPVPWEVVAVSCLSVLIQAQESRIRRLEFFDLQKARHIDESSSRRCGMRRTA